MLAQFSRNKTDRKGLSLLLLAGGVILLACIVRFAGLGAESAWIDEAYSINLAEHSIGQIIQGTAADQHPPLYYFLLHYWLMFGHNVAYARLLSAILGSILVLQVMIFGWEIGGERLGIGSALLLALSPLGVWYSQEARQYMLLACLATASTHMLWHCLHGRNRWILYWLFSSLAIYTQYFAVFIFLAHAVIVGVWAYRKHNIRALIAWVLSILGVGAVFAAWLPKAINQFLHHTMPWIGDPAAGQVRDVALALLIGSGVQVLPVLVRWAILIGIIFVVGWVVYRFASKPDEKRKGIGFIALWGFIPFLTISLTAVFYPIFQLKQYLMILPPFLLAATAVFLLFKHPWGLLLFAGLAIAGGLTMIYQQNTITKDDWRGAATSLVSNFKTGDIIYGNPAASYIALDLYWKSSLPFEGYPINYDILTGGWKGVPVSPDVIDFQLAKIHDSYKRVWLIEFFPEFWDENQIIPSWLESNGKLVEDISFGKIRLRLFELNP